MFNSIEKLLLKTRAKDCKSLLASLLTIAYFCYKNI